MKKFSWRLQRLLDIKIKQEEAIRMELVAVTEQAVGVRSRIMMEKAAIRQMLADIEDLSGEERLEKQEFFLRYVHVSDEKIARLQGELAVLEKLRREKIQEILKIRKFRRGLEKLREKARSEFIRDQERLEQNQLDDRTSTSYARKILQHA
ncbi:MAG: hypothetical protein KAR47_05715 [Planctomycetes bacterium]|nr:hypothetical protein [Planctomycetota bacterium]